MICERKSETATNSDMHIVYSYVCSLRIPLQCTWREWNKNDEYPTNRKRVQWRRQHLPQKYDAIMMKSIPRSDPYVARVNLLNAPYLDSPNSTYLSPQKSDRSSSCSLLAFFFLPLYIHSNELYPPTDTSERVAKKKITDSNKMQQLLSNMSRMDLTSNKYIHFQRLTNLQLWTFSWDWVSIARKTTGAGKTKRKINREWQMYVEWERIKSCWKHSEAFVYTILSPFAWWQCASISMCRFNLLQTCARACFLCSLLLRFFSSLFVCHFSLYSRQFLNSSHA